MKVLAIDDSEIELEILVSALNTESNIVCEGVSDSRLVIDKVISFCPDVIILDIVMPEKDGFDVRLELKSNPKTSTIPVIFLSSSDDKRDESIKIGCYAFIEKPFKRDVLVSVIKNNRALHKIDSIISDIGRMRLAKNVTNYN